MANPKVIWAFLGPHIGDNMQVKLLAKLVGNELGCTPDFKRLSIKKSIIPNFIRRASIAMLSTKDRAMIEPAWPDLVIFSGKRAVGVATWVQEQSGGKTKIVSVGRPRAPLSWFDLVITTPQYGLPQLDNVLELALPVIASQNNKHANKKWLEQWTDLPRPWVGVLVGGGRLPLVMNQTVIEQLAKRINNATAISGGSWLVSTSPRTGDQNTKNLRSLLAGNGRFYGWDGRQENHQAILKNADRFIVTGDSAMMIAEALATKKPVETVALQSAKWLPKWSGKSGMGRWLAKNGIISPPRDMGAIGLNGFDNVDMDAIDLAVGRVTQLLE